MINRHTEEKFGRTELGLIMKILLKEFLAIDERRQYSIVVTFCAFAVPLRTMLDSEFGSNLQNTRQKVYDLNLACREESCLCYRKTLCNPKCGSTMQLDMFCKLNDPQVVRLMEISVRSNVVEA